MRVSNIHYYITHVCFTHYNIYYVLYYNYIYARSIHVRTFQQSVQVNVTKTCQLKSYFSFNEEYEYCRGAKNINNNSNEGPQEPKPSDISYWPAFLERRPNRDTFLCIKWCVVPVSGCEGI